MGCFINGLQALMIENNMSSVSITANIDECGKMHINTYEREYNP